MSHLVPSIVLVNLSIKLSAKESKRTVEGVRKVAKILEW